jgi:lipoprotein-releasing system ATP-binding protein
MSELVVEQLTKQYATRAEPLVVLRDVSLRLATASNLAIVGPSGCGKSTFLQILGTLESPTSGTVRLGAIDPFALPEPALASFRNQRIGFVFQDHHLLPQCSVLENVLLPTIAEGTCGDDQVERAHELLKRVGLAQRLEHRPAELSGGERQRAAVARALICRPALILADEPTGNLDSANALGVARLLLEMQAQEAATLIVVTHSQEVAGLFAERRALRDGRLE